MDETTLQTIAAPVEADLYRFLLAAHCPQHLAGPLASLLFCYAEKAAQVVATAPTYLTLPVSLSAVVADPAYAVALPYGRVQYRDELSVYADDLKQWVRCPDPFTREEVGEMIRFHLLPDDPHLAAWMPLAYRVGFVVGWLSALSVSQPEDAQAGIVVLAALVAPLLLSPSSPSLGKVPARPAPSSRMLGKPASSSPIGRRRVQK